MSSSQTTSNTRFAVQGPWSTPREGVQDTQFLRSWFEDDIRDRDSELSETSPRTGVKRNPALGILLAIGLSLGFWAGLAWLAVRFLK